MKKIIKSRLDASNHTQDEPKNDGLLEKMKTNLLLPPPPPPPPPDIILNLQVKQAQEDPDYQNTYIMRACIMPPGTQSRNEPEPLVSALTQEPQEKRKEICRDFLRGTCKREGNCRFAHKLDLSKLGGVYTFCRQYQNSVCTFTNCKFVHADVFEEQEFYRSGYLPPHAFSHRVNMLPPPPPPPPVNVLFNINFSKPPPPPPPPSVLPPVNVLLKNFSKPPPPPPPPPLELPPVNVLLNINFSKPPPPLPNEMDMPVIPCLPSTSMDDNPKPTKNPSSLKRVWSQMEQCPPPPPCNSNYNEPMAKKINIAIHGIAFSIGPSKCSERRRK